MRLAFGMFVGVLVIAASLASAGAASADPITVDDFLTAQNVLQIGAGGPTSSGPLGGTHLGGRTISVSQGAGSAAASSSGIVIAGGFGNFTTSTTTTTAQFVLDYAGFGSLDISTGFTGFSVPFSTFDSDGNPLDVTLTLFDGSLGSESELMTLSALAVAPFELFFPLGLFGTVDLSDITGIRFTFDSSNLPGPNQAQDFTLGGNGGITIQEVPEPGTLALLAGMLGVTGLWYSRRSRVRSA